MNLNRWKNTLRNITERINLIRQDITKFYCSIISLLMKVLKKKRHFIGIEIMHYSWFSSAKQRSIPSGLLLIVRSWWAIQQLFPKLQFELFQMVFLILRITRFRELCHQNNTKFSLNSPTSKAKLTIELNR